MGQKSMLNLIWMEGWRAVFYKCMLRSVTAGKMDFVVEQRTRA